MRNIIELDIEIDTSGKNYIYRRRKLIWSRRKIR